MEQGQPVGTSILAQLPATDRSGVGALLSEELAQSAQKVVVLDDDPTGVQTVHGVPVYTDWKPQTVRQAFEEPGRMFFILTNSRSMNPPADDCRTSGDCGSGNPCGARSRKRLYPHQPQ